MRRFLVALLLAVPVVALATSAMADCGSSHETVASDKTSQPAPPPPKPGA